MILSQKHGKIYSIFKQYCISDYSLGITSTHGLIRALATSYSVQMFILYSQLCHMECKPFKTWPLVLVIIVGNETIICPKHMSSFKWLCHTSKTVGEIECSLGSTLLLNVKCWLKHNLKCVFINKLINPFESDRKLWRHKSCTSYTCYIYQVAGLQCVLAKYCIAKYMEILLGGNKVL